MTVLLYCNTQCVNKYTDLLYDPEAVQWCIKQIVVVGKYRFGTFKNVRRPCQGEQRIYIYFEV